METLRLLTVCALFGVIAAGLVSDPDFDSLWDRFKARHAKRYEADEEPRRRHIWEERIRLIHEHNLEADIGEHTFRLGLNEFTDWTREEYRQYLTGFRRDKLTQSEQPDDDSVVVMATTTSATLPAEVDWVKQGWVSKVKNQGKCGSCYTFAATGALEAQLYNKTKKMTSLSEQNLVDCSTAQGNMGCEGGVTDWAFSYVQKNGIQTGDTYPYTDSAGTCKFDASKSVTKCSGWVNIPRGNEQSLQQAIATAGPVAVAIDADPVAFQMYRSGVFSSTACSSTEITHAVLAVGYGTSNGVDYWLVKNSWGPKWGADGYIKMARNQNNMCGIATQASYPKI